MKRTELEHAIRAVTQIVEQDSVIIIGSQSILGTWNEDELPAPVVASLEVDIVPLNDDDAEALATKLDAHVGEMSFFHDTYGYYIHGVGRSTAVLPRGWDHRLVAVSNENTLGRTGLCLDPHDLCVAKLIANREKDRVFVLELLDAGMVDAAVIADRLQHTDAHPKQLFTAFKTIQTSARGRERIDATLGQRAGRDLATLGGWESPIVEHDARPSYGRSDGPSFA